MASAKKSGAFARFFHGAGFFQRGLGFVLAHRALLPWVLAPTVLTGAATVAGAYSFYAWAQRWMDAHLAGHGALVAALLSVVLFLFVVGVGYVAFLIVSLLATAPFAGALSERSERLVTGQAPSPGGLGLALREGLRALGHTLAALAIFLALQALLFFVQFFFPPLAPFLWVGNLFLTGAFLAYDAFDLPLSRRGAAFSTKWSYVGRHRAESLGFGVTVALLLALPGFNLLVPAVAVVGGTLLFVELEAAGSSSGVL